VTSFVRKLPRRLAWALAALGVLLIGAWIVQGSNSFQSCLAGDSERFDDAGFVRLIAAETSSPGDIACLGDFLDANEPTLVALATVVVAGFTGTLWAATKKMQQSTEQLARNAEETAQRQLRAYVSGTPEFIFSFDENHAPRVQFRIHNTGATPANEVRHRAAVVVLSGDGFRLPALSETFSASGVLFPNAELRGVAEGEKPLDPATLTSLHDGTARLFCYGEIDYVDAFMHPHTTRFCHEVCTERETWLKLASLHGAYDLNIEFRTSPFGNTAS
jgi:hypothetical protein